MRVSLLKNGRMYNLDLPSKVSGSFWIEDKDKNNQKRNLINIEASGGKWILKSNFETKIVVNQTPLKEKELKEYDICQLQVVGENNSFILCVTPVYDENAIELDTGMNCEIYIGNGSTNTINYFNNFIQDKQCCLNSVNGAWHIKNLGVNQVVFVNGVSVIESSLNIGDVIFIMGLKIIICGTYIIICNTQGVKSYNTQVLKKRVSLDKEINSDIKDELEDVDLRVYDKSEYFFRMPRFKTVVENEEVSIDPPPESEKDDEVPLAYSVGPMITMGITSMVTGLSSIVNVMNGTQSLSSGLPSIITCLAMLLSMIFWPLLQKKYTAKQKVKREKKRVEKYNSYIDERRKYIRGVVAKQRQSLIENNIPIEECKQIILNRKRNLWERKIEHDDFLKLRLGIGNVEPYVKVNYPEEHFSLTENNLRSVLDKLGSETKVMNDVPVATNFTDKYISAIVGKNSIIYNFTYGLILQMMAFHSYEDLKIVVLTNKENEFKWSFLKKTPYCFDDEKTIRFFSTDVDEANQISIYLENHFSNRKYEDGDTSKVRNLDYKSFSPYFVILTDDYQAFRNIEIVKDVCSNKLNIGFSLIIVQDRLLGLPNECTTFINVDTNASAIFENELTKDKQQTFKADFIGNIDINEISKVVSNIPIEMAKDRYTLPNKLGFLEMYGVGKIEQLNLLNRWKVNNPITSLAAPVGVDTNGELFKLDLHEKFHGPHGLVAGMTGSGKSEFIITYILSMAINYNPDEVAFVLIDYKGGGLAGAFENKETGVKIPHLAGTITNLDVNDMKRSLASIQSELKRRQAIFNETREKLNESTIDIYKYQKLRRDGKVSIPIPHLFIISDEFAELKAQQPEFMDQLISTARIGRSLGVHLILATQKPNGVVDDQIWSNTKFRVCLKVQDKADSVDMIKCPDAASLHNVGRFYLQVGYNEFFALGQSAYAGVKYISTDKIKKKIDTNINFINNVGYVVKSVDVPEEDINVSSTGEELSNIVKYLYDIGKEENLEAKQLWLDKIPEDIYIEDLKDKYKYNESRCIINPIIGEYDDPSTQSQHLLTLPLSTEGNTIIYGAAGMGKESLMGTIIYNTLLNHTPDEVNFYIVDCGAETLKMFESAPQVGDVILSNDTEKINNLFNFLKEEIDKRKKLFSEFGGSYTNYIKSSGNIIPNIIVMINLYEAFDELYPDLEDDFNLLTREGLKYGVIFILSTSGVNFIRYKLKQNFKQNIVLQLNDENDYSDIVGNTHGLYPSKIKGRGLVKLDDIYEFQSAKFKNSDNVEYVKNACDSLASQYETKALSVPVLPEQVNFEEVKDYIRSLDSIPVGIEKNTLNVSTFDLRSKPVTIISGTEFTAFESFVPEFLKVCSYNKNLAITFIDAEKMFENEKFNCTYAKDNLDSIFDKVYSYASKLNEVYVANNYSDQSISGCQDLLVIIMGISQFKNKLSKDNQEKLEKFMELLKDIRKVSCVIIDTIDNIKQFEYEAWYKSTVTNNYGVWIGDGISDQFTIKLSKNPKYIKEDIGNGFGYSIKKGNPILIKVLSDSVVDNGDIDE